MTDMERKKDLSYNGWFHLGEDAVHDTYLIELIHELYNGLEMPVILDFGCDEGRQAVFLKQNGYLVFGTDINGERLRTAQALFEANGFDSDDIKFIETEIDGCRIKGGYRIPFDDETFDIILSISVFEHIEKPEVVLKELQRIIKPGGTIFLFFPSKWNPFEAHLKLPVAHYFPPSRYREILISTFNLFGIGWYSGGKRQSIWLEKNVFYRSGRQIDMLLSKYFKIRRIPAREFNERFFHKKPGWLRNPLLLRIKDRILGPFTDCYMILKKDEHAVSG